MDLNQIWASVGQLIVGLGGGAVIAYGIFTWLGKRWIDSRFEKSLEAYKAKQAQELEEYKAKVTALFNHITKIHEKEFEVLPVAWGMLLEALGHYSRTTFFFEEYPDLGNKYDNELKLFLEKAEVDEEEINKILLASPTDRTKIYARIQFWKKWNEAQKCMYDFHNYLLRNKIFLSKNLFDRFTELDLSMQSIISKKKDEKIFSSQEIGRQAWEEIAAFNKEVNGKRDEIEQLIQKRLHYQDAGEW
jgi:hypothetical protein